MASTHPRFVTRSRFGASAARWLGLLGAAAAAACANGGQTGDEHSDAGGLQELKGTAQRLSASGPLPNSASTDNWAFAWRLYAEEATLTDNTFFSPYSISTASAMLFAGAGGETKAEMAAALSFSGEGDAFHQARNTVAQALEARNREGDADRNAQALHVSNDLWLEPQFRPSNAFLDTLSAYYGAGSFLAPFSTDPDASRAAINEKIADDTEQLIPELLPDGSITPDVVFVLTNALYFKARWSLDFPKTLTEDAPFQAQSGQAATVSMMRNELDADYFASPAYTAVALPYDQNELEFVAIMPSAGSFEAFSSSLTAETMSNIRGELERSHLDLRFPKLNLRQRVPLKERLMALGMRQAFNRGADLSGIGANVFLSDAFHEATITLDEEGTEAAAATAFVGVDTSAPPEPIAVTFDRPFVFFIRDRETNALLFVGHFVNP